MAEQSIHDIAMDFDEILGDLTPCLQSPECTDMLS